MGVMGVVGVVAGELDAVAAAERERLPPPVPPQIRRIAPDPRVE
jgi:hypothetical protein